jgi:hypothetical protein
MARDQLLGEHAVAAAQVEHARRLRRHEFQQCLAELRDERGVLSVVLRIPGLRGGHAPI